MRSRLFVSFAAFSLVSVGCAAQTEYLGMYMRGAKIGYSSYDAVPATFHGKKVTKTTSMTKIAVELLGTAVEEKITSVTFVDSNGRPIEMVFDNTSNGRTQHVVADFGKTSAKIKVDNTGTVTAQVLQIPKGADIVDDPMTGLVFSHAKIGHTRDVYVLDPTTVSFVKNTIVFKGKATTDVHGRENYGRVGANSRPRAVTDIYCKANGDLIKVTAPFSFEMFPESRELAMSKATGNVNVDLAFGSKITPVGELKDPGSLKDLNLDVSVKDVESIPSDEHQTAKKLPNGWSVDVHPPQTHIPAGETIVESAKGRSVWIKPDLNLPSNEPRFKKLAKTIIGSETDVTAAAKKIQLYVYKLMQPDASIAVLRNANEVLDSRRGVCRDYAILTATLMRSAGIPARLVTGLVSWDGDFYYHAWVSIFDGKHWIGVDSTTDEPQISAAHVELAAGTVGQAFTSPVLQNAVVKVVSSQ